MINTTRNFSSKMSPFLCREMLYDYVQGQLDPERRADVENFINQNQQSQADLQAMNKAMALVEQFAQTQVSGAMIHQLHQAENLSSLGRRYLAWKNWPDTLRWSTMAIAVSVVFAFTVANIPWSHVPWFERGSSPDTVELAQLPATDTGRSQEDGEAAQANAVAEAENTNVESSGDFEGPAPVAIPEKPAAPAHVAKVEAPEVANIVESTPLPNPAPAAPVPKPKGFVYRAFMSLKGLDELTPKITAEIKGLGGVKAGEVELGWQRGRASYYHFTIPESNEPKLLEALRGYGPVRISKDPHPRVMPQGEVRFILWIDPSN